MPQKAGGRRQRPSASPLFPNHGLLGSDLRIFDSGLRNVPSQYPDYWSDSRKLSAASNFRYEDTVGTVVTVGGSKGQTLRQRSKVKRLSPSVRLLIAIHRSAKASKLDCRLHLRRKTRESAVRRARRAILCSPVSNKLVENCKFSAIVAEFDETFSVSQTAWRRGRDSNPRYRFGYAGFQDRCHNLHRYENFLLYYTFQPLARVTS